MFYASCYENHSVKVRLGRLKGYQLPRILTFSILLVIKGKIRCMWRPMAAMYEVKSIACSLAQKLNDYAYFIKQQ